MNYKKGFVIVVICVTVLFAIVGNLYAVGVFNPPAEASSSTEYSIESLGDGVVYIKVTPEMYNQQYLKVLARGLADVRYKCEVETVIANTAYLSTGSATVSYTVTLKNASCKV